VLRASVVGVARPGGLDAIGRYSAPIVRTGAGPEPTRPVSVLVADDHPLFREGICAAIAERPQLRLVGEAATGSEALAGIRSCKPDLVLLDMQLPEVDGLAVLGAIRREQLNVMGVVVSAYGDSARLYRAIAAGARAYLPKAAGAAEICDVVQRVARGEVVIPRELQGAFAAEIRRRHASAPAGVLSDRELEMLRLAADGTPTVDIGERLGLSATTVKAEFQALYDKLEVNDRAAAVAQAIRLGLLV
jgi:two-component system nitrate/nitrite response regulator NarL